MSTPADHRRRAPAALRNRDPILAVLRSALPSTGTVLEIASGTGEHALHFARELTGILWQPSDPSAQARASIAAWREAERLPNLRAPIALDAADWPWPIAGADAIVAINLIHISPWSATRGLMRGAGVLLPMGAPLCLYGPYRQAGRPFAASNAAFDADLRARDPAWGIRDVADVVAAARDQGLALDTVIEMPANNLSLLFRRG